MATSPTTTNDDAALLGAVTLLDGAELLDESELATADDAVALDRLRNAGRLGTPKPLLTVMLKVVRRLRGHGASSSPQTLARLSD